MSAACESLSLSPALPGASIGLTGLATGRSNLYGPPVRTSRGEPILLVHSVNAAASSAEVRPLYDALAEVAPTYALDLPGFGLSERPARLYTPRCMTDAIHAATAEIRARHGTPVHVVGLSLGCELVARAAVERPEDYRTLVLISPTALDAKRREAPTGTTRGNELVRRFITCPLWDRALFAALTRPRVIRYFLEKTWGRREIDETVFAYAVATARVEGAEHAPLSFLSGHLFSADATRLYESIVQPVLVVHGTRGDFVDYRGLATLRPRRPWSVLRLETGALPHFEALDEILRAYEELRG